MRRLVAQAVFDVSGQDLVEYALLAGFISLIALTSITAIGGRVNYWYVGVNTVMTIPGATSGS